MARGGYQQAAKILTTSAQFFSSAGAAVCVGRQRQKREGKRGKNQLVEQRNRRRPKRRNEGTRKKRASERESVSQGFVKNVKETSSPSQKISESSSRRGEEGGEGTKWSNEESALYIHIYKYKSANQVDYTRVAEKCRKKAGAAICPDDDLKAERKR